jgi:hypothetical protein
MGFFSNLGDPQSDASVGGAPITPMTWGPLPYLTKQRAALQRLIGNLKVQPYTGTVTPMNPAPLPNDSLR